MESGRHDEDEKIEHELDHVSDQETSELQILRQIRRETGPIETIARDVKALLQLVKAPPGASWTFTFPGGQISGRAPMPVSILDTAKGWGVKVADLKDADGEPAAAGATIAIAVADATLVALTDNGDGSATFDSAVVAGSAAVLPASTAITATVTNPDGSTFDIADVITVVAGSAVTGDFAFTPGA